MIPLLLSLMIAADDPVFSGPQPGEKLPSFKAVAAYGEQEGKQRDFIKDAAGKPTLLIFSHEKSRPSAALVRSLTNYAASRQKEGLQVGVVWLTPDRTEMAKWLKVARQSLGVKGEVLVSSDGIEGPGAYGLNRKVALTILVAKEGKVTANFALIQPAVKDALKVAEAICKVVGGKAPDLKALEALAYPGQRPGADMMLRGLLRSVIRLDAKPEEVKTAAAEVEKYVGEDREKKKQLGEIAVLAVEKKYGSEAAQKQLKLWAEKYGPKKQ